MEMKGPHVLHICCPSVWAISIIVPGLEKEEQMET